MIHLVIAALLRALRSLPKCPHDARLRFLLHISASWQLGRAKVWAIEGDQSVRVGDNPALHNLDHQVDLVTPGEVKVPSVAELKMHAGRASDFGLRIDEKKMRIAGILGPGTLEAYVCPFP